MASLLAALRSFACDCKGAGALALPSCQVALPPPGAASQVVLTGAKKREDIYRAFESIYPVLQTFRKGGEWVPCCAGAAVRWQASGRRRGGTAAICSVQHRAVEHAVWIEAGLHAGRHARLPHLTCGAGMIAAPEVPAALPAPQQQQQQQQQQGLPMVGAPAAQL